jgi:hypothetical protein
MPNFAVFVNGEPADFLVERFGAYGLGQCYVDALQDKSDPNERWTMFWACRGQFPADVNDYDCYILSGSPHDAHERLDWILKEEQFCRDVREKERRRRKKKEEKRKRETI